MIPRSDVLSRSLRFLQMGIALIAVAVIGCAGPAKSTPEGASEKDAAVQKAASAPDAKPTAASPVAAQAGGEDIVDDARRTAVMRKNEARFYAKQAERMFNESDFVKAQELYKRAFELDPTLDEGHRAHYAETLMFLGLRDGEIRTAMQDFADQVRVRKQQRVAEVRRDLAAGDRYMEEDNVLKALDAYSRARQNLIWLTDADVENLRNEATDKYKDANSKRIELEAKIARERQQAASDEAHERETQEQRRRAERVDRLLERAREAMVAKNYDLAVELCDTVLELDAREGRARRIRESGVEYARLARIMRRLEADDENSRFTWEELERTTIPWDRAFRFTDDNQRWQTEVQQRASRQGAIEFEESAEVQNIRRRLASVSPAINFNGDTIVDAVNFLRQFADLNITIDQQIVPEEHTVTLKLDNVTIKDALDLIMSNTNLAYTFKYDTLFITTPENAHGNTVFNTYMVTDILTRIQDFPGPSIRVKSNDEEEGGAPISFGIGDEDEIDPLSIDDLSDLIKTSTGGEDAWDNSRSSIQGHGGQLLVTATPELHKKVQSFLENMRKDSDLFVIVETRFIDMVDDFLEDIGIDSRNLGQPPGTGFGTAYGLLNDASTGGIDPGFMNRGNPSNPSLIQGQDRVAGRIQHVLDGFVGAAQGARLDAALRGLTLQVTWLDPFQINAILRATQESREARTVTAPRVTASNGQRVHVSVITQRSYVQDYELVSGGTGLVVQEVADPVIATFQDGVILDVRPVISEDRKYITLDVKPTLASLVNGIISTVTVSLGSLVSAATLVDIDLPEITLQQAFTSVTVPDGGTVLLGGFRSFNERKYESFLPIVGRIPLLKNLFRRKAYIREKRSLYILLTARIVDLRAEEKLLFNN